MTKLKICGMRRMKDIEIINKYKPDFAGFIFAESPRRITKQNAKVMISQLYSAITPVGVFVNESSDNILETVKYCGLKVIQLHGDEDAEFVYSLKKSTNCIVWKAFRIKDIKSVNQMKKYPADYCLADTYTSNEYGGSGKTFRWDLLDNISKDNLILAGGLNPDNIIKAVKTIMPFAVDVNSGVETDGFKDENKVKQLIEQLKGAKL